MIVRVDRAIARAGRGLEGDRYFEQSGTFSNARGRGHDLTLIEAEVLDTVQLAAGQLPPEEERRNVVTCGIDVNSLVGERFTIGDVEVLRPAVVRAMRTPGALDHAGGKDRDVAGAHP